jgi:hypothetical protein
VLAPEVGFCFGETFLVLTERCSLILRLHRRIIFCDPAAGISVGPDRNSLSAIKSVTAGMVEVMVSIERGHDRDAAYHAKGNHLERSAGSRREPLDQQHAILADQEAAVGYGVAFRRVGNRGVESFADSADRGKAFVCDGGLRNTGVGGECGAQTGKTNEAGKMELGAKAGTVGNEFAAGKI